MKDDKPIQSMLEHLTQESIQPEQIDLWPSIRADLAVRTSFTRPKEFSMKKHIVLSAGAAVLFVALLGFVLLRNVTPVSARTILDKAYAVQSQSAPKQGIEHIRSQTYSNIDGVTDNQDTNMIVDSYHDLQTGKMRLVSMDTRTGKVVDVFGYDGAFTYSVDHSGDSLPNIQVDAPLTVYRTPQGQVANLKLRNGGDDMGSKDAFDKMRNDPNTQLIGQETRADGRKVYALTSQQPIKMLVDGQLAHPLGNVTVYFDVETYEMLGTRITTQKDGQDVLIISQQVDINETLPADSPVVWDLSDLQGITLIDDPDRQHGDLLPEVITREQLAARTSTAYLLETIPNGYSLEISEPQRKAGSDEPYLYIASYRTDSNEYFVIQSDAGKFVDDITDTYTTTSGLILHFMRGGSEKEHQPFVSAFVEAPNGVTFTIASLLPRETVEAWAEQLVLVK
jgi:hypothetical protein